ncbi:MauE/DoxX family redox-associated membrane protein [Hymenobacter convexus]|uniref:MauE/DoxX family redox-associated membrane protein n=1 Tax=Hymenobacter sp. CA1UV-4 TaxID=3063782 RepID=UPI002712445C|nr:MauE/DoxX family redox-associated membrane protein [Hymenobacter sp. CA1UV-4]MDO7854343.1 MauE/DoxX family redox-associated membrane protein [Hymenobacter sp. CA1UV-4]
MLNLTNPELAFVLGRLLMGVAFLTHFLVRLPKLAAFQAGMVKQFANSMLPELLVRPFAAVLPFVEGSIGLLLIIGLFTRPALAAALLLMTALVFGSSLLEQWDTVGTQLVYGLFLFALVLHCQHNRLCLDRRPATH